MTTTGARCAGAHKDNPPTSRNPLSGSSGDDSERSSRLASTPTTTTNSDTPLTPTRGRSTTRYPDSLGRVPLHRRGTSKTYERLEDLLREAGYKETRVFTPEAERNAKSATEKQESDAGHGVRGGVGAVMDFFAGLVSRGSSVSREAEEEEEDGLEHAWSPPPSPSLCTIRAKDNQNTRPSSTISLSRNGSSDNLHRTTRTPIDLSTDMPPKRTHASHVVQRHQSSQGLPHQSYSHSKPHHHQHRPHQHSHHHHHHPNNYSSKPSIQTNPPNARAYLRHMASAPNIQPLVKRPSLSEASLRSHAIGRKHKASTRRTLVLNDEDSIIESDYDPQSRVLVEDNEHEAHPPMPRNWLESVAKALLAGSGGSAPVLLDSASVKSSSTRKSSALSDKSNQVRGRGAVRGGAGGAKPPLLCVQVQDLKAKTIEGQVSCTSVMCRSAPTSRANSRVRGGTRDGRLNGRNPTRRRGGDTMARDHRPRGKERSNDILPSLARTKVENDDWMAPRHRYLGGWGMDTAAAITRPDGASSDESDDEDDEDEGELGLDRLLVPARRQHSIQSLRRHLQRPRSQAPIGRGLPPPSLPRSGRASPFGGATIGRHDLEDSSWGTSRGQGWLASQTGEDGEEEGYTSRSEVGSGRSSTKWRRGIPGPWAQWTTAS